MKIHDYMATPMIKRMKEIKEWVIIEIYLGQVQDNMEITYEIDNVPGIDIREPIRIPGMVMILALITTCKENMATEPMDAQLFSHITTIDVLSMDDNV
jgi:hypothetical protein